MPVVHDKHVENPFEVLRKERFSQKNERQERSKWSRKKYWKITFRAASKRRRRIRFLPTALFSVFFETITEKRETPSRAGSARKTK